MNPNQIKRNFERGLWTVGMVALTVAKGLLTPEQFTEITGVPYEEPTPAEEK